MVKIHERGEARQRLCVVGAAGLWRMSWQPVTTSVPPQIRTRGDLSQLWLVVAGCALATSPLGITENYAPPRPQSTQTRVHTTTESTPPVAVSPNYTANYLL